MARHSTRADAASSGSAATSRICATASPRSHPSVSPTSPPSSRGLLGGSGQGPGHDARHDGTPMAHPPSANVAPSGPAVRVGRFNRPNRSRAVPRSQRDSDSQAENASSILVTRSRSNVGSAPALRVAAIVHPADSMAIPKELAALVPPERRSSSTIIEVNPEGAFVTYGIGVSLMKMRVPEKSRAHVPVNMNGAKR